MLLATGMAVGYCYLMEAFTAWYSGDLYDRQTLYDRAVGLYAWSYWGAIACNVGSIQVLWWPVARRNVIVLFAVSFLVTIGMWLERFMLQTTRTVQGLSAFVLRRLLAVVLGVEHATRLYRSFFLPVSSIHPLSS